MANRDRERTSQNDGSPMNYDDMVRGRSDDMDDMSSDDDFEDAEDLDEEDEDEEA